MAVVDDAPCNEEGTGNDDDDVTVKLLEGFA